MMITCAALLCDADGTLVDSTAAVERTWRTWAAEYGLDAATVIREGHGRRTEETVAAFLPPQLRDRGIERIDELELADLDGVRAVPGAAELLAAVQGLPCAVVTSCSRELLIARMGACGLALPSVLVTADDVAAGKPAPEAYLHAAALVGVPVKDCVVVEDAPAGVRAGRAAGATVIAVTTTHTAEDLDEADAVVDSLACLDFGPSAHGHMLTVDARR